MELKTYETPEVDLIEVHLDGSLLQASVQGFTNDEDFNPGFFGLV